MKKGFSNLNIGEWTDQLLESGRIHSEFFCSAGQVKAREAYLKEHPTKIILLKCSDGRVNFGEATKVPSGILSVFANIGAKFDFGWANFVEIIKKEVAGAEQAGRKVLFLISYHYSRKHKNWGCAGFKCDQEAAIAHAQYLKRQVEYIYKSNPRVHALVCGLETDYHSLVLHNNGDHIVLSDLPGRDIREFYSNMPKEIFYDLSPLVNGNIEYIRENKNQAGDNIHRERAIIVGAAAEFLTRGYPALVIGPYGLNLTKPIATALHVINKNIKHKRISDDGLLAMTSVFYREEGSHKAAAILKSESLSKCLVETITELDPELAKKMIIKKTITHLPTRKMEEFQVAMGQQK